ncbi:MAG: hypothetical protein HY059_09290 [Proteobacteria bacterium]|nr:hypothetical protein [Pseudomonadota bacterium]
MTNGHARRRNRRTAPAHALAAALLAAACAASARAIGPNAPTPIDGNWNEVEVGCGIELGERELRQLPLSGGQNRFRRNYLHVERLPGQGDGERVAVGSYSAISYAGEACRPDSPVFDYERGAQLGSRVPVYCGSRLLTRGIARVSTRDDLLEFSGKIVQETPHAAQFLGVAYNESHFRYRVKEGVLILIGRIGDAKPCDPGQDFYTYWIPAPDS